MALRQSSCPRPLTHASVAPCSAINSRYSQWASSAGNISRNSSSGQLISPSKRRRSASGFPATDWQRHSAVRARKSSGIIPSILCAYSSTRCASKGDRPLRNPSRKACICSALKASMSEKRRPWSTRNTAPQPLRVQRNSRWPSETFSNSAPQFVQRMRISCNAVPSHFLPALPCAGYSASEENLPYIL